MKRQISIRISALLLGVALLGGCGRRGPAPAQLAPDELFTRAQAAYQEGDYSRATQLLQTFVEQHLGDPRAPEARLLLGRAHMQREEYIEAATNFQRLVNDFPASPLQVDARFGICQAYYELSPRPALDQEYTRSALLHCESIPQYYPGTGQAGQAEQFVNELRVKLAQKAYEAGLFYMKRRAYDAAVVYLEDVIEQYPRTPVAPQALEQLIETYRIIGYVEEADAARERLLRDYPDSPQAQAVRA